jgi:hypothetical protein
MIKLPPEEIKKRIKAWADVTMLSLNLKLSALRKKIQNLEKTNSEG